MGSLLKLKKGQSYKCIMRLAKPSGYGIVCHVGGVYSCPKDGYIIGDNNLQFKPYPFTLSAYLEPTNNSKEN